jgi:hypothetical protein
MSIHCREAGTATGTGVALSGDSVTVVAVAGVVVAPPVVEVAVVEVAVVEVAIVEVAVEVFVDFFDDVIAIVATSAAMSATPSPAVTATMGDLRSFMVTSIRRRSVWLHCRFMTTGSAFVSVSWARPQSSAYICRMTTVSVATPGAMPHARTPRHSGWITNSIHDAAVAFIWVPFAVAAGVTLQHGSALLTVVWLAFLLSFAHQPLTLGLVYGDSAQFGSRRRLYSLAPIVAIAAIAIGLQVSLTLVAVVAALWNAEHTLMQRFGVIRMYGRKAGDDHGRTEKAMIMLWLAVVAVIVSITADLDRLVVRIGMGTTNRRGVEILGSLRPVAIVVLAPLVAVAAFVTVRWCRLEASLGWKNTPKYLYVAATAALLVTIAVNPIVGFAGYVSGHALEYFVVVHRSLRRRSTTGDTSAVARATATRARRAAVYLAYFVAVGLLIVVSSGLWDGLGYRLALFFFGALHIFYDGFVWKLRRPALARSLGLPTVPSGLVGRNS